MNLDMFSQQIEAMNWRLEQLYQGTQASNSLQPELLPLVFKELGVASEELQIAIEELQQKNQALLATQAALEVQLQRYQEMFDLAPCGYLVTDAEGIIQEANYGSAKLLKVSPQFLIGKPLATFVSEEDRNTLHSGIIKLQTTEQVQNLVVRLSPRHHELVDAVLVMVSGRNSNSEVVNLRICIHESNESGSKLPRYQGDKSQTEAVNDNNSSLFPKQVYLRGEIIPLKPRTVYQVCQGIVKLSTICENGEEVLIGLAAPAMPFGSELTKLETYQAIALSRVELVSFSLSEMLASPSLTRSYLQQTHQRLQQLEAMLAISGRRRVKDRLDQLLTLLKQEFGQPVAQGTWLSVRLTHQELADACSTTRVTITRLLGQLQEQGKVIMDAKNHLILTE